MLNTALIVSLLATPAPTEEPATNGSAPAPAVDDSVVAAKVPGETTAADGPVLRLGLQLRPRLEKAFSGNLGAKPGNPNFRLTQRSRASIGAAWGGYQAFVSVQDVRTWATETSTLTDFSADNIDFHEAWGEAKWETDEAGQFGLRVGRQELVLDGQRLVGSVNWAQQARSFDGLKLFHKMEESHAVTLFAGLVPDGGLHFMYLAHLEMKLGPVAIASPWIVQTNNGIRDADRGARIDDFARGTGGIYAKMGGDLSWRTEAYAQWTDATFAALFGGRVGYKINDHATEELWFDFITGQPDAESPIRAFDTLFATNHKFYGFMDRYLNIPVHTKGGGLMDIALKHTGKLGPGKLHAAAHLFIIPFVDADGMQGPSGFEFDLVYTWPIHKMLKLQAGEGIYVDIGDYARGRNNVFHDWFFLQLIVNV